MSGNVGGARSCDLWCLVMWAGLVLCSSFLYYLEGHSLLLRPVHAPIKAKIDHVSQSHCDSNKNTPCIYSRTCCPRPLLQVAVGFSHILVVTYESTVFSWGAGSRGQLGHGDTEPRTSPQLVEALKGRTIARYSSPGLHSILR